MSSLPRTPAGTIDNVKHVPSPRFGIGPVEADGTLRDAFRQDSPPLPFKPTTAQPPPTPGTWYRFRIENRRAHIEGPALAAPGSALANLYALAARRGLNPLHPPEVMEETARLLEDPGIEDPNLTDLTHLPFITIDEIHSKDLDQALFVQRGEEGYTVWYAIADPSWYVRPGSALFAEALARGATYYLPGLVIPMLPRALSEDLVSINPEVNRRAMVFEVLLTTEARVQRTRIHRARVRSRVKTSYDAVQAWYDGLTPVPGGPLPGSPPPPDENEIAASLQLLREVGSRRRKLAEARDVIAFRRQEIAVSLAGAEGLRFVALADPRNDVERDNEQISLLCNIEGARFLLEGDTDEDHVQPIYRVHNPPAAERLDQLADQIDALVELHHLPDKPWRWRRGQGSLADYLKQLPQEGPEVRLARAIHRQAMLTGGRSLFVTTPGSHFGVGADVYGRFTAPMREIVGIFAHKEAWEKLHGPPDVPHPPWDHDEALRRQIIEAANRSRETQRKLDRQANGLVLDQLFGDDLVKPLEARPTRRGTVLGITRSKVHIGLDDPPIDVKVYIHRLGEWLEETRIGQGRDQITLQDLETGRRLCAVGDDVRVRVREYDAERKRWGLEIL